MNRAPESRVVVIEGQRVLAIERTPPLPPSLSLLLDGGRDAKGRVWAPLRVLRTRPLPRLGGASAGCMGEDHRLVPWLDGFHIGSDRVTRSLHLNVCADCGTVCVRDASFDMLEAHDPQGRGAARPSPLPPRRKDHLIAWYSGSRPNQRQYR